jgi:hypothetical protein
LLASLESEDRPSKTSRPITQFRGELIDSPRQTTQ